MKIALKMPKKEASAVKEFQKEMIILTSIGSQNHQRNVLKMIGLYRGVDNFQQAGFVTEFCDGNIVDLNLNPNIQTDTPP